MNKLELMKIEKALNNYFDIEDLVTIKDLGSKKAPYHVPENIKSAFEEGATCVAMNCWNAAASMFRLCVDLATKSLLPDADIAGLNNAIREKLGLRLNWLFKNK